jgi:hypothetical protein
MDTHSHIGDLWQAYWKKNVEAEDHLAWMDTYGIDSEEVVQCPWSFLT